MLNFTYLKFLLSFVLYVPLYLQFDIMFDKNPVDFYVSVHLIIDSLIIQYTR